MILASLGCGAESGSPLPLSDGGADASSWPPVTQCPPMSVTAGSLFQFAVCDLGTEMPRFVTIEECARRNGVNIETTGHFNSSHPEQSRCAPLLLSRQVDVR